MNRRKFLKSAGSFLVAIPFLIKDHEPVDEASQDGDYTGLLLFNNVSQDEYEIIKEYYVENVREHKYIFSEPLNCRCQLEWVETE